MTHKQPELPYDLKALDPFVSEEQMDYHYNKHHATYFKKLNGLIDDKPESDMDLRDIVINSKGGVFNNAAQAWNHTFFWDCMTPSGGGGKPPADVLAAIEAAFGSYDEFKTKFSDAAAALFGSGWAWLAKDASGKLEIMPLSNADTPLKHGKEPILTLDVWEHAYYIDYRNRRPDFIEGFWDVINWDFAKKCFDS
ncbi:MAG: superoxide dismutase [Simkaniaceae bacterium]|nr:superoxide dismutase [Simkaniaceae bacterium]